MHIELNDPNQALLDELLEYSFNAWGNIIENHSPKTTDVSDISEFLDDRIQRMVLLSEYLDYRGAAGCGDHGHEEALKQAHKKLKKVRKAMGYTYP